MNMTVTGKLTIDSKPPRDNRLKIVSTMIVVPVISTSLREESQSHAVQSRNHKSIIT